jgi:hypothetical protein
MKTEDRAKLRRILASFDEAGLVALANKGLVRRAQKDLETGGLSHEETDSALLVRGPDWTVTMPADGPAHATDDTRASGVTRQILTATLYLRAHWTEAEPAAEPEPAPDTEALQHALLDITIDDLQKWAGKTLVREAFPLVESGLAIEVETHAGLTLRLTQQEIEARLLPGRWGSSVGKLLDEILTTAPRTQHKRWVIVAILAFQRSRGLVQQLPDAAVPTESAGTPLTRQQVLASAQDLLEGMVATGLAHPSGRMVERLFTLSVAATAAHLPRLARQLRALSDDVSLVLDRSAEADTARLFEWLCQAHALTRALLAAGAQAPVALVGRHRTQYDPAGDLDLAGVGAFPWQTASGYEGLTVLFWDGGGRRFVTWTASRPSASPGRFSMSQTYRVEAVWGGGSPERLSRSRFTLRQARANPLGRLSGGQASSVAGLAPIDPATLDFPGRLFTNWGALRTYAMSTYPIGLAEKNPLDRIVVLQPATWGPRIFDELQQQFCWQIHDDAGAPLILTLPWTGVNEVAVEFLEALKPDRDRLTRVVARLAFGTHGLQIEPLSLLSAGTPQGHSVLNPGFDRALIVSRQSALLQQLREKYGRDRIPTTMTADDDGDAEEQTAGLLDALPPGLRGRLVELEGLLLRAAESGLRRLPEATRQRLRQLATALDQAGFPELGAVLADVEQTGPRAGQILRGGYLCQLHRQAIGARLGGG